MTQADLFAGAVSDTHKRRRAIVRGEALSLLAAMPDACVDGVVTDPPYSSGGLHRGDRVVASAKSKYINTEHEHRYEDFAGDSRDQRGFTLWCALWLAEAMRVTRSGGVVACFTDWRQLPSLTDAIQAGGWVWRGIVPWNKTEASRPVMGRFRAQCEYVVWGSKGALSLERDAPVLAGAIRTPVARDKEHPTEKPVRALRHIVQIVERGGLVLDPFSGGGTTGIAATLEGRDFLGFEITDHYAALAEVADVPPDWIGTK